MRRYWIPNEAFQEDEVVLKGDVLHHIRDVCRMHIGSKFEVIVEGGKAHLVEITSETKHESRAKVLESRQILELPRPHIHLALSIPRFPVFEAVVEKAVELGVKEIHPFFSEYSFIRKQEDVWEKKLPRFEKIVMSATQQSGRGELMTISNPVRLDEMLKSFNRTEGLAGLFAYEGSGRRPDGSGEASLDAKEGVARVAAQNPQDVWAFCGSEGGFSDKEVELFQQFGLTSVTLGPQVLRVETACVTIVSILKYGLDLMR